MPKVNKSLFTKEQWKKYKARRDALKAEQRAIKDQNRIDKVREEIEEHRVNQKEQMCFVLGNGTSREAVCGGAKEINRPCRQ